MNRPQAGRAVCRAGIDVMCSPDGAPWFAGGGTIEPVCPPMSDGERPFDCEGGHDYDVGPAPGSYLDENWNTSDSGWLTRPR